MATATNSSGQNITRNLERVIEDAVTTGELRINGRKLRDFPKISSKYDLSDTVFADLSKNRFTELPFEVCNFLFLESLDCYHNTIRSIPDTVIYLHVLTQLNLSRNQLATIPPYLCHLPALQVLIISHNKLVSLPEEIGLMENLMELDASCNEISHLPSQIGDLISLRSLNLRRNRLVELPLEIICLHLVKLDISGNRIAVLPPQLRLIESLLEIALENNPLTSPPAHLCTRGRIHIFKYLEIQAIKEDKKRGIMVEAEFKRTHKKINYGLDGRLSGLSLDSRRSRYTVDSGYSTSDGGDRRWSAEMQELNEVDAARKLALRAAEFTKEQRHEREKGILRSCNADNRFENNFSNASTPSTLSPGSDMTFEDEISRELGKQHIKYDEIRKLGDGAVLSKDDDVSRDERKRISRKLLEQQKDEYRKKSVSSCSSVPPSIFSINDNLTTTSSVSNSSISPENRGSFGHIQTYKEYKEALKLQRGHDNSNIYKRHVSNGMLSSQSPDNLSKMDVSNGPRPTPTGAPGTNHWAPEEDFRIKHENILQQQRYEAQLAQLRNEEEKKKQKQIQKEAVLSYVKSRTSPLRMMDGDLITDCNYRPHITTQPFNGSIKKGDEQMNLNFVRPDWEKAKEEKEQIELLRMLIESRLKVTLPEDLAAALIDGVVLCHLANHVRPRSVSSIHVPSPAVPKLTLAKCRRNVECFLEACKKIGVEQDYLCTPHDVLDGKNLQNLSITVQALLKFHSTSSSKQVTTY